MKKINNRRSKDEKVKPEIPFVDDELSDVDIEGIDETTPMYRGLDRRDEFWIGEQSSYTKINESDNMNDRLNEQRIEIITQDKDDNVEIGYDYFNAYRFKRALAEGVLHFAYRKVNGDAREAYGTTKPDILRKNGQRFVFDRKRQLGPNIRYYDMYCRGWRSFKPDRLVRIFEESGLSDYK